MQLYAKISKLNLRLGRWIPWPFGDGCGFFEPSRVSASDEAQMALCHLDFISNLPGVHPHRVAVIRGALERLAGPRGRP